MANGKRKLERRLERAREKRQVAQQELHRASDALRWVREQYDKAQQELLNADHEFDVIAGELRLFEALDSSPTAGVSEVEEGGREPEDKVVSSDGGPAADLIPLDDVDEGGDEDGEE